MEPRNGTKNGGRAKHESDHRNQESSSGQLQGWRLLGLLTIGLLLMACMILVVNPSVEGVRMLIRATARTSLLLFCLAFTASAAWKCFPNRWTGWQRRNRRYLGLGFAVSHLIHATGIAAFAMLDAVQFQMHNMGSVIPRGVAYVFIVAMAVTSFDRSANWIGSRTWKLLHTAGVYYIWISFMMAFGKRILQDPAYTIPAATLILVMAFRLLPLLLSRERVAG